MNRIMAISNIAKVVSAGIMTTYFRPQLKLLSRTEAFVAEMKARYQQLGKNFDGDDFKERVKRLYQTTPLTVSEAFEHEKEKEREILRKLLQ